MELKKGVSMETINYIVFFKGLKNVEIEIVFNDIQSFTDFQAQLNDTWFDFMLIHTFAKNVVKSKSRYLLLISWVSSYLKSDVKNKGGVARWRKKNFKNRSYFYNTVVAPFLAWIIGPYSYLRRIKPFTWILY